MGFLQYVCACVLAGVYVCWKLPKLKNAKKMIVTIISFKLDKKN